MSKKKIATLLVAGTLAVSIVGGTLAWFTSTDNVTNEFSTPGATDGNLDGNSGVKIHENFDKTTALNVTPGTEVNKEVQVHSNVKYDQFVKVKITPEFTNAKGEKITTNLGEALNTDMIELSFTGNLKTDKTEGSWYKDADGYYYYIGKVGAGSYTNTLLKSVKLNKDAGNQYKGVKFDVKVEADSIQATNDAYKESWGAKDLHDTFAQLQTNKNVTPPTDIAITTIPAK